jgi:hypothetical protein
MAELSEKAIKAGVTHEDAEFLAHLLPKLLIGAVLNTMMVEPEEERRMLSILDKMVAVDPHLIPEHMKEVIDRIRIRVTPVPPVTH